jgi:hypothetical protein
LHDVATIAGVPTVLYGVSSRGTVDGSEFVYEDFNEVVYALGMQPGGWTTTRVADINTWESGFSRLALTNDGTVVGSAYSQTSHAFYATVVPGSPAAAQGSPPDAASLGLADRFDDCSDCPSNFTISADGESIAWTEGAALTVVDTTGGGSRTWTVPALGTQAVRSLDVRTSSDGGVEAAISFGWDDAQTVRAPVVAATSPPGEVVESPVDGHVVTFAP